MSHDNVSKNVHVNVCQVLRLLITTLAISWASVALAGIADDLVAAARTGDIAAVQALLDKGADLNARSSKGGTALGAASYNGNLEVVRLLIDKGADVNAVFGDARTTALELARQQKHSDVVQLLLDRGAKTSLASPATAGPTDGSAQNSGRLIFSDPKNGKTCVTTVCDPACRMVSVTCQ